MPWRRYKVGYPETPPRFSPDCRPFQEVYHVTHQRDARRIFEDGRIRSGLVWDESRLNSHRACVSWVSANYWVQGSIYGNICFNFNWRELIEGKQFYWVEDMPRFRPPAFRILVSNRDCADLGLTEIDVSEPDSPLWSPDGESWYFNSNFNSEFMIDEDIPLDKTTSVSIVDHHSSICHGEPKCASPYRNYSKENEGSKFFAWLIGKGLNERWYFLEPVDPQGVTSSTYHSLANLHQKLERLGAGGWNSVRVPEGSRIKILQNILLSWSNGVDVVDLLKCFPSDDIFRSDFEELVSDYFGTLITL